MRLRPQTAPPTPGPPALRLTPGPGLLVRCQPCRAATAAVKAVRMASTGPGRPVISSTWATAWCSSTVRPLTTRQPAARADPARGVGHGAYTTSTTVVPGFQRVELSGSAAPPGSVEMTRSASGSGSSKRRPETAGRIPSRSAVSRSSPVRARLRTSTTGDWSPSSRTAARADWAVPPAPRMTAWLAWASPASRSAATRPATSVLSARLPSAGPPGGNTSVFAAPTAFASGDTSSAMARATRLSGIVSDKPAHSGPMPSISGGSPGSSHSIMS